MPGAVADLGDWVAATRLKVARLLHTLVLHQELGVTQYLAKLAAALTGALADEEPDVRLWVRPVRLPDSWCLLLRYGHSNSGGFL